MLTGIFHEHTMFQKDGPTDAICLGLRKLNKSLRMERSPNEWNNDTEGRRWNHKGGILVIWLSLGRGWLSEISRATAQGNSLSLGAAATREITGLAALSSYSSPQNDRTWRYNSEKTDITIIKKSIKIKYFSKINQRAFTSINLIMNSK